ncbi:hypothetical protein TNCV_4996051 [Trichonephila clavipes]|nr:hypothetical protein TNCV_4996051 [Trichonephila clavipes]
MQGHVATLGWGHLHHPPYSPDLTPSDFYLFPALKKNLAERRFGSNAEAASSNAKPEFSPRGLFETYQVV